MGIFDYLDNTDEIDIYCEEAQSALDHYHNMNTIMILEDGNGKDTSNIFKKVINKIKAMIDSVIGKIQSFFSSQATKKQMKVIAIACKENPKLKNEKVKIFDSKRTGKLAKETQSKLMKCKTKEEAEAVMVNYRKKRKALLAAGCTVTLTVAALAGFLLHGGNKQITELKVLEKNQVAAIENVERITDVEAIEPDSRWEFTANQKLEDKRGGKQERVGAKATPLGLPDKGYPTPKRAKQKRFKKGTLNPSVTFKPGNFQKREVAQKVQSGIIELTSDATKDALAVCRSAAKSIDPSKVSMPENVTKASKKLSNATSFESQANAQTSFQSNHSGKGKGKGKGGRKRR